MRWDSSMLRSNFSQPGCPSFSYQSLAVEPGYNEADCAAGAGTGLGNGYTQFSGYQSRGVRPEPSSLNMKQDMLTLLVNCTSTCLGRADKETRLGSKLDVNLAISIRPLLISRFILPWPMILHWWSVVFTVSDDVE